jgi:hypothetical protein
MSPIGAKLSSRIADFFHRPVDAAFGRTTDGREFVYLWPWQRKAYVLPSDEVAQQLRATMHWWVRMALPIFVLFAVLGVGPLVSFGSLYLSAYYVSLLSHVNRMALGNKLVARSSS